MCVRACVSVCVCARARASVFVCVCVCLPLCLCVNVCALFHTAASVDYLHLIRVHYYQV